MNLDASIVQALCQNIALWCAILMAVFGLVAGVAKYGDYHFGKIVKQQEKAKSKRDLESSAAAITAELQKYPIAAYRLHYRSNDREAVALAQEIDQILINSKWKRMPPITSISMTGADLCNGIIVFMLKPEEPFLTLSNQLYSALGNKGVEGQVVTDMDNIFKIRGWPAIELPAGMNGTVIFVGSNPEK